MTAPLLRMVERHQTGEQIGMPLPRVSALPPDHYTRVRSGTLSAEPPAPVVDRVRDVLHGHARGCHPPTGQELEP